MKLKHRWPLRRVLLNGRYLAVYHWRRGGETEEMSPQSSGNPGTEGDKVIHTDTELNTQTTDHEIHLMVYLGILKYIIFL